MKFQHSNPVLLIILAFFIPAQIRNDDFVEFDYTVLLHEMPSQVRECR